MYNKQNVSAFKWYNACFSILRIFWAILDQSWKLKLTSILYSKISIDKKVELWTSGGSLGILLKEQKLLNMMEGNVLK